MKRNNFSARKDQSGFHAESGLTILASNISRRNVQYEFRWKDNECFRITKIRQPNAFILQLAIVQRTVSAEIKCVSYRSKRFIPRKFQVGERTMYMALSTNLEHPLQHCKRRILYILFPSRGTMLRFIKAICVQNDFVQIRRKWLINTLLAGLQDLPNVFNLWPVGGSLGKILLPSRIAFQPCVAVGLDKETYLSQRKEHSR